MMRLPLAIVTLAAFAVIPVHADIRDSSSERTLSISADSPALVVPRSDWSISREQRRSGVPAVYYMMSSESTQIILSVYIDKTAVCSAATTCLAEALTNESYREAKEQRAVESGIFQATQFYLDNPKGAPIKQAHILAAAYVDGHWFDVHISAGGANRPNIEPLLALLRSLRIQ